MLKAVRNQTGYVAILCAILLFAVTLPKLTGQEQGHIVVFIRVQKTGSTTISSILSGSTAPDCMDMENVPLERIWIMRQKCQNVLYANEHLPFATFDSLLTTAQPVFFCIMIREAVPRAASEFQNIIDLQGSNWSAWEYSVEGIRSIHDWLQCNACKVGWNSRQTRMLGAVRNQFEPVTANVLSRAKRRMDSMAFVGILERFDESILLLQWTLGLQFRSYSASNRHTQRPRLTRHEQTALADVNGHDTALYEHGIAEFRRRYSRLCADRNFVESHKPFVLESRRQTINSNHNLMEEIYRQPPGAMQSCG